MSFEYTSIWAEVKNIIAKASNKDVFEYKVTIHTKAEDFGAWDLSSLETSRDYLTQVAESGKIIFRLGLGDYTRRFYPYRSNLEVTIRKTPVSDVSGNSTRSTATSVVRYKAIFNPAKNPQVGGTELENQSTETLNTADFVEVHLELLDRAMEPLRIKTASGAYTNNSVFDVLRGVLGGESVRVLVDGKPAIQAIDIVKPDRTEPVKNLIVPHGRVKVANFPTYVQEYGGGVYNRGLGTFFQIYKGKRTWFVYPTFDKERFDEKGPKLVVYCIPQEKLPQLDQSHMVEGDVVKVIATAQRKYTDSAELGMMNGGSGFRMADAKAFMKKPVEIIDGKVKAARGRLNHEVVIKEREDGLNYAPVTATPASANPYAARSKVNSHLFAQIDFVWENSDPDLIFPGMPCKCIYLSQGKPVSLKGTILLVHTFSVRLEKYNASAFRRSSRITIACEPQTKLPDIPTNEAPTDVHR